jgi:HEAT repeat protein
LSALQQLAASDPAPQVRVAAIEAIGLLGGDEAPQILSEVAAGDEDDLAEAAVRALGRLRSPASAPALRLALRAANPRRVYGRRRDHELGARTVDLAAGGGAWI